MARSIESLLDLSTMSIEEAIGRLKVVDTDEPQHLSGPITTGGKLLLTREQWAACQGDRKKGESSSTTGGHKCGKPRKARKVAQAGARGRAAGDARGGALGGAGAGRHETTPAAPAASLAIGPGTVDSHDAPRPTSHRRRRRSQLCSWHM
jgi:hypothetical protein